MRPLLSALLLAALLPVNSLPAIGNPSSPIASLPTPAAADSQCSSLTRAPEVQSLIQAEIDKVNTKFARVEQIKQFRLLDTQLTAEDDELTPTMKLKRKFVEQKYSELIESMYRH